MAITSVADDRVSARRRKSTSWCGGWVRWVFIVMISIAFPSILSADDPENAQRETFQLVPLPGEVTSPPNNPSTAAKVELGKLLFFDPRLSGSNEMSCATCHIPEKAFADGLSLSPGAGGRPLERNTQSCLNVGFYQTFFWDGRAASLEQQALTPIESPVEMNQDLAELERELAAIPDYVSRFQEAFGSRPSRQRVAEALAVFQRTLVTEPSPFDRFLAGDKKAISADARRGLELFQGEAGCIECHHGPLLSDGKFYRLGVSFKDQGRARVTGNSDDRFRFRTPGLRNVAETGPYMHDGSMQTLEQVVTFYFRGIPSRGPDGLLPDTQALSSQSFSDIDSIVAFLKSLSGRSPVVTKPSLP